MRRKHFLYFGNFVSHFFIQGSTSDALMCRKCCRLHAVNNLTNYYTDILALASDDSFFMSCLGVLCFSATVRPSDNLQHLEEKGEVPSFNGQ